MGGLIMAKIINFQPPASRQLKMKYIITIDEDETPVYAARELKPGVITLMIMARNPEEAETIRKKGTAIVSQGWRSMAGGSIR
jgi:N-dimethylarginine dimethylaminohydrolase